ncbi:hypothetical protein OAS39_08100 [Pirellulales bacterium]|nr:hypothetical protein [Pirellulales bacterium]
MKKEKRAAQETVRTRTWQRDHLTGVSDGRIFMTDGDIVMNVLLNGDVEARFIDGFQPQPGDVFY